MELFVRQLEKNNCLVRKLELPTNDDSILDKYGLPKLDFITYFCSNHYDLIIDATPSDDPFGPYVVLNATSNLRVGYRDLDQPQDPLFANAFDLLIIGHGPFLLPNYLKNMADYLSNIRK